MYGYLRIEVTQLLEAISEFNTHHCKVLVQELVDDIIRQKGFPGAGWCDNHGITRLDTAVVGIPYILAQRNLSQAVVEKNTVRIIGKACIVDKESYGKGERSHEHIFQPERRYTANYSTGI